MESPLAGCEAKFLGVADPYRWLADNRILVTTGACQGDSCPTKTFDP